MTTTMMEVKLVPVRLLVPSPTNPRKFFSEASIAELVTSLSQHGVKTPLSVRPWPADRAVSADYAAQGSGETLFEIVAGERRYRAAKGAELEDVPCIVQEMTDAEVLELQLIENLQREDLMPLEEAGGYAQMLDLKLADGAPAYTPETIALKIGKRVEHVYERLRLLRLPLSARKAMQEGKLPARQGLIIAQQPTGEMREALTAAVLTPEDGSEPPLSVRGTVELVRSKFMVALRGAPWSLSDAELLASAGACTTCPHRAGNMTATLGDFAGALGGYGSGGKAGNDPNVCVNPTCFRAKQDAFWARAVTEAEKSGQKVLSDTEAEKHFYHGGELKYSSGYVEAGSRPDAYELRDGVKKAPTWEKIASAGETTAPIVLARDPSGKVHRLVDRSLAVAAAKENKLGILRDEPGRSSQDESRLAEDRKRKKSLETQRLAMDVAMERMVASPCLRLVTAELVSLMTGRLVEEVASDRVWSVVKRRELGGTIHDCRGVLEKAATAMSMEDQTALMAELLFFQTYSTHSTMAFGKEVKKLAEFCGVNLAECKTAAAEQLLQRKANRGKKAPAPWAMPEEATDKIFFAWLAKDKAELAATPASRAKARADLDVRAEFVLWLSLEKAKAGTGRTPKAEIGKAESRKAGSGTANDPFKWNGSGVCLNPQVHTVKFSSALAKKWGVEVSFAGTGAGWGFGYNLQHKDGGSGGPVRKEDCTRIFGDAIADAKTFVGAWMAEHSAPGAVTFAVADFFDALAETHPELGEVKLVDTVRTALEDAAIDSAEFGDALGSADPELLRSVMQGLNSVQEKRRAAIQAELDRIEAPSKGKLPKEARAAIVAAAKARWAKVSAKKKGGK
jgi:ParB/RepB/Spo0J family partition protein